MTENIDIHTLELLASKICHDLISPIGAINNGLEFMGEGEEPINPEIIELIAHSSLMASAKLQAYRLAYGQGGGNENLKAEDAYKAIERIVSLEKKVKQIWKSSDLDFEGEQPKGLCKILTCALLLGIECLPKGGTLKAEQGDAPSKLTILCEGQDSGPRGDAARALGLEIPKQAIEPKYVHAFITGLICHHYAARISLNQTDSNVTAIKIFFAA